MAVSYPIPPWLQMGPPPNPAEAFISSLHTGVQIGQENQRLQQQRQLAEMELQAKQAEAEQRSEIQRQEIEYDKAYKDAELGLQQQKLEEAQQVNQIKVQDAARRWQAQQRVQAAIQSGQSPESAMLSEAANLDLGAGDIGALSKANRPPWTPSVMDLGQGRGSAMMTSPTSATHIKTSDVPSNVLQPAMTPGGQAQPGMFIGPKGQVIKAGQQRDPEEAGLRRELATATARLNAAETKLKQMQATRTKKTTPIDVLGVNLRRGKDEQVPVYGQDKVEQAQAAYDAAKEVAAEKKATLDDYRKSKDTASAADDGSGDEGAAPAAPAKITHRWEGGKLVPVGAAPDEEEE